MPALQSRVDRRFPITVVALTGSLDSQTVTIAETALRECLAEMPAAVVIDAGNLTLTGSGWQWLASLTRSAELWPQVPVAIAGGTGAPNGHQPICRYESVAVAVESLGHEVLADRRRLTLPPDASSCEQARELVSQACADWGLSRPKRLAELLASELVANVVRHARTALEVTVRRHGEGLEVSVRDYDAGHLPPLAPDPRGFGLQLVDQLSDSWGWAPAGAGKVVWTRLPGVR